MCVWTDCISVTCGVTCGIIGRSNSAVAGGTPVDIWGVALQLHSRSHSFLPWLVIQLCGFSRLLDGLHKALHFTVGSWPQWGHLAVFKAQRLCKVSKVFPIEQQTVGPHTLG